MVVSSNYHVIAYSNCALRYQQQLPQLFLDYFIETHGEDVVGDKTTSASMVTSMIDEGRAIYLLLDDTTVVGFIVAAITNHYNMIKPLVANDFMYIVPEHRNGKAVMFLYTMLGAVCDAYGCGALGTTFHQSSNIKNNKLIGGIPIATVYEFPLDKIRAKYKKYKRKLYG